MTNKLLDLLDERFEKIRSQLWDTLKPKDHDSDFDRALDALWAEYLNGIDCEVVDQDDIVEDFENLFNFSSRTRVCRSEKSMRPRSMWSITRPGVPMTICAPWRRP